MEEMSSTEKYASRAEKGNDLMRMLGAPPIPANQSNQPSARATGIQPGHFKSRSEVPTFNSPQIKKLFENKQDIAENRKRDHELQKKFVKMMKEDMLGNHPVGAAVSRISQDKTKRGSPVKSTQQPKTKRHQE